MGFHEYLHVRTEPTNKKSRFAVAVISHENSVVGHLMKEKSGRFAKTIFYFLRASKYHGCRVRDTNKDVSQGDDKGTKIQLSWCLKDSQNL